MNHAIKLLLCLLVLAAFAEAKHPSVLRASPEMVQRLETLKSLKKFEESSSPLYPGSPNEATRIKAQAAIDTAISELITASNSALPEEKFWFILEAAARKLSMMDSEEMDRGLAYMEEIMDIYDIQSSEGRLNRWRYGFETW